MKNRALVIAAITLLCLSLANTAVSDTVYELASDPADNDKPIGVWSLFPPEPWLTNSITFDPAAEVLEFKSRAIIFKPFRRQRVSFDFDRAWKLGGGSWGSLSDRRVKKNIRPYDLGSDQIEQVNPKWFQYNGAVPMARDTGRELVGIIAQEVQPVFPNTVSNFPDLVLDESKVLSFDSSEITYALVNAVKDQASKIRDLNAQADELITLICRDRTGLSMCNNQ